jgi:flavin reductase (DIM6/NTAB) family NADH-FMN oxidoreductase RutF
MELEPAEGESFYRTLSTGVVPRPIAWVSSRSADGVDNLAPFSFFNVVCVDPPMVGFAPSDRRDGSLKDTPRNVVDTEEFVVNVVTMDLAEEMNATSGTFDPGESEFEAAGIDAAPSTKVTPARVADAKISFECELHDTLDLGASTLVIGEVVLAHVDEAVTTADGKLDVEKLDAVGRLAGSWYTSTRDRFEMERPP